MYIMLHHQTVYGISYGFGVIFELLRWRKVILLQINIYLFKFVRSFNDYGTFKMINNNIMFYNVPSQRLVPGVIDFTFCNFR
jgi:hypothetical protein